jgi:hypothetical protein
MLKLVKQLNGLFTSNHPMIAGRASCSYSERDEAITR